MTSCENDAKCDALNSSGNTENFPWKFVKLFLHESHDERESKTQWAEFQ